MIFEAIEPKTIGIVAALGSAASWAVGSILFAKLGERLSPLAMTLAKGIVSIFLLALVLVFIGYKSLDRESILLLGASGLLGIGLGDTFFFAALQDLGPQSLILLSTLGQVLTVLLAVIFLGEHPSLQAWSGIVLVILGVSAVIYTKMDSQEEKSGIRGIILGLLSVLCMSIAPIISKNGLAHISTIQGSFVRMFAGTLGVFIFGLFTQQIGGWMQPFKDSRLIGRFLLSVCVITFGGFWLSLVAIKYVDVAIANTLNSTEPIFVLPLTVIFLKEKIALNTAIGTILTMTGIVLLCSS